MLLFTFIYHTHFTSADATSLIIHLKIIEEDSHADKINLRWEENIANEIPHIIQDENSPAIAFQYAQTSDPLN